MDILIVTDEGAGLGLADRLNSEGNNVQVVARKSIGSTEGRLFKISDNLQKSLHECKFIICDIDSWNYLDQRARYANRPVIGSHAVASVPNRDAFKQFSLFKRYGLSVPVTEELEDIAEAFNVALKWDAHRTVIRYADKEFKCDYKDWLSYGLMRLPIGQRILLQQLAIGYEVLITGWFDGLDWVDAFSLSPSINFKMHKFAAVTPLEPSNKLVQQTLVKLRPYFAQLSYAGPVHVEIVLNEKEFVVQRLHVGFLFPLDYIILEFIQGDLTRFLSTLAFPNGVAKVLKTKDLVGVVQAQCMSDDFMGAPILGLNPERLKHVVFHAAQVDSSDGSYQLASRSGDIFTASAHAPNLGDLCSRVYTTVEAIKFPEKHYNNNLGSVVGPTIEKVKSWGYLNA